MLVSWLVSQSVYNIFLKMALFSVQKLLMGLAEGFRCFSVLPAQTNLFLELTQKDVLMM